MRDEKKSKSLFRNDNDMGGHYLSLDDNRKSNL